MVFSYDVLFGVEQVVVVRNSFRWYNQYTGRKCTTQSKLPATHRKLSANIPRCGRATKRADIVFFVPTVVARTNWHITSKNCAKTWGRNKWNLPYSWYSGVCLKKYIKQSSNQVFDLFNFLMDMMNRNTEIVAGRKEHQNYYNLGQFWLMATQSNCTYV